MIGVEMDADASQQPANKLERNEYNKIWLRFLKSYLEFGIKIGQVNFAGSEQDGFGLSVRRSQLPLWSRAAEIYYFYFNTIFIASCLLQLDYERVNEEFKVLQRTTNLIDVNNGTWLLLKEKELELESAFERIKILGNRYYQLGLEPVVMTTIVSTYTGFVCYLQVRIYNYLRGPIEIGVARLFLDPNLERKLMIKNELSRVIETFIQSTLYYLDSSKSELFRSQQELAYLQPARISHLVSSLHRQFRDLELCQELNVKMLHNMVASGQLDPLNRRPEWINKLAHIFTRNTIFFLVTDNIIGILVLIVLPSTGWINPMQLDYGWRGRLFTLEVVVYCLLYIQWLIFPILLLGMNTLDQVKYAIELRLMALDLASDILRNPAKALANNQLQRLLIQYKLFKHQVRSTQPVVGFISANVIGTMLLGPALARLYVAKLSADIRYMFMMYSLFVIVAIDGLLMGTCYLHARCLDVYRAMSSLLGRLDAIKHFIIRNPYKSPIHLDEHTLWVLRRELHQPEFATQQFETDAYFMTLTYANLMGVHFYCGLWLVPMLMRDTSRLAVGTNNLLDFL